MTLYCATGNPGKLREFRLAAKPGIAIEALTGIPACEENGSTFEENAIAKALHYGAHAPGLLFADDSGLEVDALNGAPGIYSARYAGNDADNNARLLRELESVTARGARFVCVIALVDGAKVLGTFRGEVEGEILRDARGEGGFGYDPLFYYPPFGCSLAEIPAEKKFAVSHRGKALAALMQYMEETSLSGLFLQHSLQKLEQMTAHIETCLGRLSDAQIWNRDSEAENAVGNLVLHLCGNVRQWIGHGIGGEPDIRVRDAEFAASGGISTADLSHRLRETVDRAKATIAGVSAERLAGRINPQDGEVSVLEAIYQVVGHFQQHTGQIMFVTKQLTAKPLDFYKP